MKKTRPKKIPPIRVGSKAVTYTELDGGLTFHCEIVALYQHLHPVTEVNAEATRGLTADLKRPDGTGLLGVEHGTKRGQWCRPHISSISVRGGR